MGPPDAPHHDPSETRRSPETRSVLLRHETPDGSHHLDWLIERPGCDREHRLIAFRCMEDPLSGRGFRGERIPDHRVAYLDHEGPISGGRGRVARLWRLPCRVETETPGRLVVVLPGVSGAIRIEGRAGANWWTFGVRASESAGPA
jgi:hypothetical protein